METKKWFLKTDYYFQLIMLTGLVICTVSVVGIIYAAFGLFPFGLWQVVSALVLGIGYRDKKRLYYLGVVTLYFISVYLLEKNNILDNLFGIFVGIALFLGGIYFIWTRRDYIESKNATINNNDDSDLLDA